MKRIKIVGLLFMAVVISLGSCSKEGPAGPQGPQGEQGRQGEQGPQGIPGADGSTIYSGNGAPTADIGQNGDFYIDLSASMLYGPKTDNGWGNGLSLKGEKGDKGDTGQKGDKGDSGRDGKDGSRILSGTSAPTAKVGKTGDYYWDVSNYTLYGPKTSSGWGNGILLRGPKGDKGDKGDPGNANVISSGWFSIPSDAWVETQIGALPQDDYVVFFSQPGDKDMLVGLNNPYKIDSENTDGAILVYVDLNNRSILPAPFEYNVEVPPSSPATLFSYYDVKFRFVMQHSGVDYLLYPVVALREDSWSVSTMENALARIKWKVIVIPSSDARRSSPPPDPKDYKATCAYYGIPE